LSCLASETISKYLVVYVVVYIDVVGLISELHPPTGLMFIPQMVNDHGGMILTRETRRTTEKTYHNKSHMD
jgi:hypothetical protein